MVHTLTLFLSLDTWMLLLYFKPLGDVEEFNCRGVSKAEVPGPVFLATIATTREKADDGIDTELNRKKVLVKWP
jgi:hypothetical protein